MGKTIRDKDRGNAPAFVAELSAEGHVHEPTILTPTQGFSAIIKLDWPSEKSYKKLWEIQNSECWKKAGLSMGTRGRRAMKFKAVHFKKCQDEQVKTMMHNDNSMWENCEFLLVIIISATRSWHDEKFKSLFNQTSNGFFMPSMSAPPSPCMCVLPLYSVPCHQRPQSWDESSTSTTDRSGSSTPSQANDCIDLTPDFIHVDSWLERVQFPMMDPVISLGEQRMELENDEEDYYSSQHCA